MKCTLAVVFTILALVLATPVWADWRQGEGDDHHDRGNRNDHHDRGNRDDHRNGVPEIDPGFAQSALTVFAGGVLMLKGRRRK